MVFDVLELMPDAVVVVDHDGLIRFINRAGESLFGYDRTELLGRPMEVLIPSASRDDHRRHREAYAMEPHVRPMGLGMELRGLTKDGHEVPVEISLAPAQFGSESLTFAAVRDVTQRKRLEEQAREAAKAKEEVRRRDEVLAVASHELRGPVGVVRLQVGVLRQATADTIKDITAMADRLRKVERNTEHVTRLVDDLLDVRQLQDGSTPLHNEDVDLTELTKEAVERVREHVERTGTTLTLHAPSPVVGRWDPVRIEQVVTNLLMNAAKFGQGKPISVEVVDEGDRARLTVTDQGIGIEPTDLDRIFERFERVSPLTGGLGLGLYISRQIVQAHGGRILVRSVPGAGASFTVELPREPARSTA